MYITYIVEKNHWFSSQGNSLTDTKNGWKTRY